MKLTHTKVLFLIAALTVKRVSDLVFFSVDKSLAHMQWTEPLRRDAQQLFISPYTHRPVQLATLRRWMVQVMQGSTGSTMATATSCVLLHEVPLQQIVNSADWTRKDTPFRHYIRTLPAETRAGGGHPVLLGLDD